MVLNPELTRVLLKINAVKLPTVNIEAFTDTLVLLCWFPSLSFLVIFLPRPEQRWRCLLCVLLFFCRITQKKLLSKFHKNLMERNKKGKISLYIWCGSRSFLIFLKVHNRPKALTADLPSALVL